MLKIHPIDRRSELTYEQFLQEYVIPGKPVIITDLNQRGWVQPSWTIDYLLSKITAEAGQKTRAITVYNTQSGQTSNETYTLAQCLHLLQQRTHQQLTSNDDRYYLRSWQFRQDVPALIEEYKVPDFFAKDYSSSLLEKGSEFRWLFIGEESTYTQSHIDYGYTSAWLYLVTGRKRWRCLQQPKLYEQLANGKHENQWFNPFNLELLNDKVLDHLPNDSYYWEGIQHAGEIAWTPPLCLHAVRNLDFTIALTQNYLDITNLKYILLWLKLNKLPAANIFNYIIKDYKKESLKNSSLIDLYNAAILQHKTFLD